MKKYKKIPLYKITITGDWGVGKSSFVLQWIHDHFVEDYDPTYEDHYRKQELIDGEIIILDVFDVAGRGDSDFMKLEGYRLSEGFFFAYSIASSASFDYLVDVVYEEVVGAKGTDDFCGVVIANKVDLEDLREIPIEQGRDLARKMNCGFF